MGRSVRRKAPSIPPVERIEVNETNKGRRMLAAVLFLIIGGSALAYGFFLLVAGDSGWRTIQANGTDGPSAAEDFVLNYYAGAAPGVSAAAESRALTALYTETAERAYRLFTPDAGYEGVNNIWRINRSPNEELQVDEPLYRAFELLARYGRRELYLGPVLESYDDIFYAQDDVYALDYDPWRNEDAAAYYAQIAGFAMDPESIDLELLGDKRLRLKVSEDYLAFIRDNEIENLLDFGWLKNAFITDFIADTLIAQGYTQGSLTSVDGFSRSLGEGQSYSQGLYHKAEDGVVPVGTLNYEQPTSLLSLRGYPLTQTDLNRFYVYDDGQIRGPYLGPDGRDLSAVSDLTVYSQSLGCAQLLLRVLPIYVAPELDEEALADLAGEGIYALWCREGSLYHTEASPNLSQLSADPPYAAVYAGK